VQGDMSRCIHKVIHKGNFFLATEAPIGELIIAKSSSLSAQIV